MKNKPTTDSTNMRPFEELYCPGSSMNHMKNLEKSQELLVKNYMNMKKVGGQKRKNNPSIGEKKSVRYPEKSVLA